MKQSYGEREDQDLRLFINLSRAYLRVERSLGQVFAKHDLTSAQFAVLEVLYHKGSLSVGEIVKSILTTSGNITVVIKNLERDGLVRRKAKKEDRRVGIISITAKGRKLIEQVFPDQLGIIMDFFELIEPEEKEIISKELKKLWYHRDEEEVKTK